MRLVWFRFCRKAAPILFPMLLYTAIFFGITYFFSLKPAKVVDVVGKFMTPVLLLSIGVIFVAAVFNPLGAVQDTAIVYENGPFIEGLLQGYLALDGLQRWCLPSSSSTFSATRV